MRESIRRRVAERARFRCEYCQCPDSFSTTSYDMEHILPRARGGTDALNNLAYSCSGCNGFKAAAIEAIDPLTNEVADLFHPRQHLWADHFEWSAEKVYIIGRTAIGNATVQRLRLNRPGAVNLRAALILLGQHPPQDLEPLREDLT